MFHLNVVITQAQDVPSSGGHGSFFVVDSARAHGDVHRRQAIDGREVSLSLDHPPVVRKEAIIGPKVTWQLMHVTAASPGAQLR